jgi:hypothetical protein
VKRGAVDAALDALVRAIREVDGQESDQSDGRRSE